MTYTFKQNIAGSNNGYEITYYQKGQTVEKEELCEYLTKIWTKAGIIAETSSDNAEDAGADENGETGTNTPDDTENSTDDTSEGSELTDEKIGDLVYQAKEILETEGQLTDDDIAKLKEIGVELKIEGMISSKKPQTILDKINGYIDEYDNIEDADIPLE